MGNYRFKVSDSDMIPNAWFYKLKDMGSKTRNPSISHSLNKRHHSNTIPFPTSPKHHHHPHLSPLSKHSSSYFSNNTKLHTSPINPKASDTHLPDPAPQSRTKRRPRRRRRTTNTTHSSLSNRCTCRTALNATDKPIRLSPSPSGVSSLSSSSTCRFISSTDDIVFDIDSKRSFSAQMSEKFHKFDGSTSSLSNQKFEVFDRFSEIKSSFRHQEFENFDEFNSISALDLPPILTKLPKFDDQILGLEKKEPEFKNFSRSSTRLDHGSLPLREEISSLQRLSSSVAHKGLKIRANSPRLASKKIQAYCRKSNSASPVTPTKTRNKRATESFVVVKSSFDPQKDFRDSMVEMIVENNIWASKDLEELLTCYLSLNSEEHHDMIVKVFEQLWFDLADI